MWKKANITTAILTEGTWDGELMGTLIAEGKAVALKKCRNQEWPSDAFSETPFREDSLVAAQELSGVLVCKFNI